jgi:hypothetical protein
VTKALHVPRIVIVLVADMDFFLKNKRSRLI